MANENNELLEKLRIPDDEIKELEILIHAVTEYCSKHDIALACGNDQTVRAFRNKNGFDLDSNPEGGVDPETLQIVSDSVIDVTYDGSYDYIIPHEV